MSTSESARNIANLLEKYMKLADISPCSQKTQAEMFEKLKKEARERDEFIKRYNKPRERAIFRQKIVALLHEGKNTEQISEIMSITDSCVRDELRKAGYRRGKLKHEDTIITFPNSNSSPLPKPINEDGAIPGKKKSKAGT